MSLDVGTPVVVVDVEGIPTAAELVHLAAPAKRIANGRIAQQLDTLIEEAFAPETWPTVCGMRGYVHRYGGVLLHRRACSVCSRKAPA